MLWLGGVFVGAVVWVEGLTHWARLRAGVPLYVQPWTSEQLMQGLSLRSLRQAPLQSLLVLHIQPPVYDAIRAILVQLDRGPAGLASIAHVDRHLYHVWALVCGAVAALLFHWVTALVGRRGAAVAVVLFLVHPGTLFYATTLDGTFLSAAVTTGLVYELWRYAVAPSGPGRVAGATLAAYFTRSLYQWPFALVVLGSLAILRASRRHLLVFGLCVGGAMGLYTAKQLVLFGIVTTSSFQGYNLARSIEAPCDVPDKPQRMPVLAIRLFPVDALIGRNKLDGSPNLNFPLTLDQHEAYMRCYLRTVASRPLGTTLQDWLHNASLFLLPSSRYTSHHLVDALPWREPLDRLLSGWWLVGICAGASALWVGRDRRHWRTAVALALPVAYAVGVSIVAERGENMRFKYIVEPVLLVLVVSQVAAWGPVLGRSLRRSPRSGSAHTDEGPESSPPGH